jgi:hypothetical protein
VCQVPEVRDQVGMGKDVKVTRMGVKSTRNVARSTGLLNVNASYNQSSRFVIVQS